jgi:hypothetical protein
MDKLKLTLLVSSPSKNARQVGFAVIGQKSLDKSHWTKVIGQWLPVTSY